MAIIIGDGTGSGRKAKVNSRSEIETRAATISSIGKISEVVKDAFEFHPPRLSIATANGDMPIVYFKNISDEKNFHLSVVRIYWNGGDASPRDKALIIRTYKAMTEPNTDVTTGQFGATDVPHNLNLSSNREPDCDFRFWDATGTYGMTINDTQMTGAQKGDQINCGFFAQGYTEWKFYDALILGPGNVIGFSAEAVHGDGQVILVPNGYFKKEGE